MKKCISIADQVAFADDPAADNNALCTVKSWDVLDAQLYKAEQEFRNIRNEIVGPFDRMDMNSYLWVALEENCDALLPIHMKNLQEKLAKYARTEDNVSQMQEFCQSFVSDIEAEKQALRAKLECQLSQVLGFSTHERTPREDKCQTKYASVYQTGKSNVADYLEALLSAKIARPKPARPRDNGVLVRYITTNLLYYKNMCIF